MSVYEPELFVRRVGGPDGDWYVRNYGPEPEAYLYEAAGYALLRIAEQKRADEPESDVEAGK